MIVFARPIALVLVSALAAIAASAPEATAAAFPAVETHTYKRVGSLEIKADVHLPGPRAGPRPTVVYLHGGSLINGGRQKMWNPASVKDRFLEAGAIVVSIDYRLAPESKIVAIAEDVDDAFKWVREKGPALFGADPTRIAAAGGSAGGYLTLLAGHRIQPRLVVLMAESSYCNLIGPWQMRPSIHPPHYKDSNLDERAAWQQVSGPPIANSADRRGDGSAFNDFIRRQAGWPKAISGWDPKREAAKFSPYAPILHVTPDYPPTIMIHGEVDTDVPREQAETMARELQRQGVEHELIVIRGGEHAYRGADPAEIASAQARGVAFVLRHLGLSTR